MNEKQFFALVRDGTVPSSVKVAAARAKRYMDYPVDSPEWKLYVKAIKPIRIAKKRDKKGNIEYLQQNPYGTLEVGLIVNNVDDGTCPTTWELAKEFMDEICRDLRWNKLPFKLNERHIEEIKKFKLQER